jgi:ribosomal protein S27E
MGEPIGEYLCDRCGKVEIHNCDNVVIIFPKGIDLPIAKVRCERCGGEVVSRLTWEEAILFDRAGAKVEGYSFVRGAPITEKDIEEFMNRFDDELSRFLDDCKL